MRLQISRIALVPLVGFALTLTACWTDPMPSGGVTSISITTNPATSSLGVGETVQFNAVAKNAAGAVVNANLTWNSSNPSVLPVASGVGVGLASGPATVTASAGGVTSNSVTINVIAPGDPRPTASFIAFGSSERNVSLGWKAVAGASGYRLERQNAGTFAVIATLSATETGYLDGGLTKNTAYTYRLSTLGNGKVSPGLEVTATTTEDAVLVTPEPALVGTGKSGTVGAAGGTVQSADGTLILTVPAGAFQGDVTVNLQASENPIDADNPAFAVDVPRDFAKPLTLSFAFTPDEAPDAANLGVALWQTDGSWVAPPATVDGAKRTVSVVIQPEPSAALRRANVSVRVVVHPAKFLSAFIAPKSSSVAVGGTVKLTAFARIQKEYTTTDTTCTPSPCPSVPTVPGAEEDLAPLPIPRETKPFLNEKDGFQREWTITEGYGSLVVEKPGVGASYQAPDSVPSVNPAIITFTSQRKAADGTLYGPKVTATAKIRVLPPPWTGTVSVRAAGDDGSSSESVATITWKPEASSSGSLVTYRPEGNLTFTSTSFTGSVCTNTTVSTSIDAANSLLKIDFSQTPPSYQAIGLGSITVRVACPSGTTTQTQPYYWWITPPKSVSSDGKTISDSITESGITQTWNFTAQTPTAPGIQR